MDREDFIKRHKQAVAALWRNVTQRYQLSEEDFVARLHGCAERCVDLNSSLETHEFLEKIRVDELALALACEQGDETAWRDFEANYRQTLYAAARSLTKDDTEAEDLAQSLYGELFGVRIENGQRLSKLAHYAGRGSLGGWLRAVVYQSFIDRKRQTARFEQLEDDAELDRVANQVTTRGGSNTLAAQNGTPLSSPVVRPDEIEDTRLKGLTEEALREAFASLEARDRLLLNYYYFDELTLREIGLLMGVHEATISRWLVRAQQAARRKTEDYLSRKHGLRKSEVAECLQMAARSEIDLRQMIGDATSPSAERAP